MKDEAHAAESLKMWKRNYGDYADIFGVVTSDYYDLKPLLKNFMPDLEKKKGDEE